MSIPAHNGKKAPQFSSFKPAPTPQKPDDCCCEGACSAPEPIVETVKGTRYSWKVSGMDCAACARKVENAVRQVSGVNQVQVQSQIGMTFANALRSILRQDPDIIMVGEMRDTETA